MSIRQDPEGSETAHLHDLAHGLEGKQVLEVGCGAGRLTWRYASSTAYVLGIDHNPAEIARGIAAMPVALRDRVELRVGSILDFEPEPRTPYDIVLLSWSL